MLAIPHGVSAGSGSCGTSRHRARLVTMAAILITSVSLLGVLPETYGWRWVRTSLMVQAFTASQAHAFGDGPMDWRRWQRWFWPRDIGR